MTGEVGQDVEVSVTERSTAPSGTGQPHAIVQSVALSGQSTSQAAGALSNIAFSNVMQNNGRSQQNAVSNQQALSQTGVAVTGASARSVNRLGPLEARSAVDVLTNNELAQTIDDLSSVIAALSGARRPSRDTTNVHTGKLYAMLPHTFVFLGEDPDQLEVKKNLVGVVVNGSAPEGGS
ncbi:MAG: hypothetical protein AAF493_07655 [Pseudomonadota bacterium]